MKTVMVAAIKKATAVSIPIDAIFFGRSFWYFLNENSPSIDEPSEPVIPP